MRKLFVQGAVLGLVGCILLVSLCSACPLSNTLILRPLLAQVDPRYVTSSVPSAPFDRRGGGPAPGTRGWRWRSGSKRPTPLRGRPVPRWSRYWTSRTGTNREMRGAVAAGDSCQGVVRRDEVAGADHHRRRQGDGGGRVDGLVTSFRCGFDMCRSAFRPNRSGRGRAFDGRWSGMPDYKSGFVIDHSSHLERTRPARRLDFS